MRHLRAWWRRVTAPRCILCRQPMVAGQSLQRWRDPDLLVHLACAHREVDD